jgi:hypothetical protein
MERRSLAALAVAALFVSAVAWFLLSGSQGDDSYDRVARTWIDGEDPELAGSADRKDQEVATETREREERESAKDTRELEELPEIVVGGAVALGRLEAPGIVFEPVREGSRSGRLQIELERWMHGRAEFPILVRATSTDGVFTGLERRLIFATQNARSTFVVEDLDGDVDITLEFTDAAPIELHYAHGEYARRLALDLDQCQRLIWVDASVEVAQARDALSSAAFVRAADVFDLVDVVQRPVWVALGERGRASDHGPFELMQLDDRLEHRAVQSLAGIRLPLRDGGDEYTSDGVAITVGRDWRVADIRPLAGWPLALPVSVREGLHAPARGGTAHEALLFDLVPDPALVDRPGAIEFDFPIGFEAPRHLDVVGYGLGVVPGVPSFVRARVPIEAVGGRGLARCTYDPVTFAPPQRFMLRIEGHQPLFFAATELLAKERHEVVFTPGGGGVALASFTLNKNSREIRPPAVHHTLLWNEEVSRVVDPVGFAEFASPEFFGALAADDLRVAANDGDVRSAYRRRRSSDDYEATDAAPGVVELVIEYERP